MFPDRSVSIHIDTITDCFSADSKETGMAETSTASGTHSVLT